MASAGETALPESSEREFTSLLIYLYRDCPELWKVKSKDYFNKKKKCAALEKIVGTLKMLKPDFTVKQLKAKINVLRTNFNREFKAMEGKRVLAMSTDDIPEPSLWYYNDLCFIKDQMEIAVIETSQPPNSDEDSQSLLYSEPTASSSGLVATPTPMIAPPTKPGIKRKGESDSTDLLLELATEYFKRPQTEEDILAKGWAMKLRRLSPDQRRFAEKIINDTLFEAGMGTLTREGVRFPMPPQPRSASPPSASSSSHQDFH